jgi:hypothetical protein
MSSQQQPSVCLYCISLLISLDLEDWTMSTIIFPLPKGRSCWHASLWLGPSIYAEQTEYKRPGEAQRIAAATISKERPLLTSESLFNNAQVFPGPLILPGDDLATDPDCPKTSRSGPWIRSGILLHIAGKLSILFPAPQSQKRWLQ